MTIRTTNRTGLIAGGLRTPLALAAAATTAVSAPALAQTTTYDDDLYWSTSPESNTDRWTGQTNRDWAFDEDLDDWQTEGYSYYASNYWNQVGDENDRDSDWRRQYSDDQWDRREGSSNQYDGQARSGDRAGQATLTGEISQVQRALRDVQGHALFRVRTADGQSRILAVDPQDASKLRMKQGERVQIKGERAMIGSQQVIKVSQISKQGQTQRMSGDKSMAGHTGSQVITGRIDDIQRAARQVEGHNLYRVRMANGQTRVLAAEPYQAALLRVKEGDRVQIKGKKDTLEDKQVFKVDAVRVANRSGQSDWQNQQSGQQSLSGRLVNVQRANRPIEGHTLYRVRLDNGQSRILALEPNQASRLRMNEGDRVRIRGTSDMVQNQRVLKVSDIQRQGSQNSQTGWRSDAQSRSGQTGWRSQSDQGSQAAVDGRLSSVERSIRDVQGYALFRVRMDDGRSRILAVEPDKAQRLRMTQGDRVQIKGERAMIGEQQVIKVSEIKTDASN